MRKPTSIAQLVRALPHGGLCSAITIALASIATPAMAHHPMGGAIPRTAFEGFMSGLAHPVIGIDHLAFVVAIGLIAATRRQGFWLPIAVVLASMIGTGLHLQGYSLPNAELLIAGSVLGFGLLLARGVQLNLGVILGLGSIAGLFHGYAYGEAIFGAESTPLTSYLVGFSAVQLLISTAAFWIAKFITIEAETSDLILKRELKSAGLVLMGIGLAVLIPQLVAIVLPIPGI